MATINDKTLIQWNKCYPDARSEGTGTLEEPVEVAHISSIRLLLNFILQCYLLSNIRFFLHFFNYLIMKYSYLYLINHILIHPLPPSPTQTLLLGEQIDAVLDPLQTRTDFHFLPRWPSLHGWFIRFALIIIPLSSLICYHIFILHRGGLLVIIMIIMITILGCRILHSGWDHFWASRG